MRTSPRSKDTRARARTSNTPNVHYRRQLTHVAQFQGHPCSCAYFKHSKCPYPAASAHVDSFQRHPCSCAYFKQSKFPPGRHTARLPVPRTPVLARVLQTLQMSILGGLQHVSSSQGHPSSCACFSVSKFPFWAAVRHAVRSRRRAAILESHDVTTSTDSTTRLDRRDSITQTRRTTRTRRSHEFCAEDEQNSVCTCDHNHPNPHRRRRRVVIRDTHPRERIDAAPRSLTPPPTSSARFPRAIFSPLL